MSSKEVDLLNEGVARGIFPPQLYKYRDLGDRTFDIIRSATMWFSTAASFNDPFDCELSEARNHTLEDLNEYLTALNVEPDKRVALINIFHTEPSKIRDICISARRKAVNERGILSLSKVNSNILMWSHYAREHTGVVLGFEILKDAEFFLPPWVVSYSDTYEELNYFRDRFNTIRRNLSTKAELWKYEEEIRIVKPESRAWKFKRECLRDVFFGCRTPQADIDKFMQHCRGNGFDHTQFFRAEMEHGSFSLRFVPIP